MRHLRLTAALVAMLLLSGMAVVAHAVDGVTLITQNTVLAAGGFPFHITQPGSYRLASNLIVPNANTTAVQIDASHVTLDLNGFAILGPTDCSGGLVPCAGAGSGIGINAPVFQANITIRNGTIQGMGLVGISLNGEVHLVEDMHVRSNGAFGGIQINAVPGSDLAGSIVRNNTVQRNGGFGIITTNSLVTHNVVDTNVDGIFLQFGGLASYNVVTHHLLTGLTLQGGGFIGNVLTGNGTNLDAISGSLNLGQNLCGQAICPGAQF